MASLVYTPLDEIEKIRAELQAGFNSGKTKSIAFRKYQLLQFAYLIQDNAKAFEEALASDLGRHALETNFLEIGGSIAELMDAYKNIDSWVKPEKPPLSVPWMFVRPVMYKEPKGVVLIISAFNLPLWLCASPVAGALAAGNAIYLDPSVIRVVNGAIPETTKLLSLPWGHILYTGNGRVGRIVATAAAQTLTPVSLELGGKSPVFVDPATDMQLAAKRILWGRFTNGGQTCTAPDYVLVPRIAQDSLVEAMKTAYANFYPETTGDSPIPPQNITKMVHQGAFNRVNGLLQNTQGTIVVGGESDAATRYIAPTIVKDVKIDDSLMEIFGPVLPIVPVDDLDSGLEYVNSHDHPLALYVFSQNEAYKNKAVLRQLMRQTLFRLFLVFPSAALEGVALDTTQARQVFGFLMFTHLRASIDSPGWMDKILGFRFPPYTSSNLTKIKRTLGIKLPPRPTGPPAVTGAANGTRRKWFLLAFAVAILGALTKMKNRLAFIKV
ncbi:aldehyde dehydrogenase [Mycena galopus ATCC 62051]|nr:aldehyde dehydrogenase [Mycena galopus ATCC 62051]